jgi:hypothetical protein
MRTANLVLCASALLLTTGGVAAGCIDNTVVAPLGGDAGLPSIDSGSPDAASSGDATAPVDATVDAPADAGIDSAVTINTATVDFGLVNCGTGTASQTYSFTNTSPLAINYTASVPTGSVFSITAGSSGLVTPGATGSITVAVAAIPTTSTAGTAIASTLTLTTNVPSAPTVNVPLKVTPQGGSLAVTPALAGFGQVQLTYAGTPIPLALSNVGNAPVTLTFGAPTQPDGGTDTEFGLVYAGSPAAVTLAAGNSLADAGATFLPTTPGAKSVTLAMQTTDALCASASGIAMSGTGTPAQVAVGPSPLQFGAVPCGTTHGPLQVTLTNTSPGSVAFTAALGLGTNSPFNIDTAGSTVPGLLADGGAGTFAINVSPKAIPVPASLDAGAFNDTLTVTPTAPFVSPTVITLEESASGAILAVNMTDSSSFGSISNQTASLPFTVTNTGNVDAPLNVLLTGGTGYDAGITSVPATATADGGAASGLVAFTPTANGEDDTSLSVSTTAPLCAAPPGPISITATGAVPVASFPSTAIPLVATCAAATNTPGTLTITNNGNAPLTITNAQSTNGNFIVSSLPGSIAGSGGTGQITIAASAVGQGTASGTVLNDTLTFSTNEPGAPPRSAPVTVTLSGANLAFQGGNTVSITACGSSSYVVVNTGDVDATVLGASSYPSDTPFNFGDAFSSTGSPTVAAGGNATDTVSFNACGTSGSLMPCTVTGTPQSFTATTALGTKFNPNVGVCIPLPALNVSVSLPNASETCQQQCCG